MNIPALFSEIELSRITVPPRRLRELRPEVINAAQPYRREQQKTAVPLKGRRLFFRFWLRLGRPRQRRLRAAPAIRAALGG